MRKAGIVGGGLGPLLSGLLAAGLVTLTLTVAVALGMQEQEMIAAVEPTATRILPSPTMTATSVPVPSPTSEPPVLLPAEVSTESPTEQATETPTPSPMPSATARATSRPRVYATATSRPAYVAPVVTCRKKTAWPVYVIQRGDTLYGIAGKTRSSVSELMQANCLASYVIPVGGILYVPRLPAKPTALPAPKISRFTVAPSGQVLVGQCVQIGWSVTGRVTGLTLKANSTVLWNGTKATGTQQHCPSKPGQVVYRLTATGPGGTTWTSRAITAYVPGTVSPTDTSTPLPGPTGATSTPGEPTTAPTTVTAVSPEPATATPADTSVPPPTDTSVPPPTATSAPPPTATSAPPPTATSAPPPTATSAPPPTATSAPPPTATSAPPPTATTEAERLPGLPGLSWAS